VELGLADRRGAVKAVVRRPGRVCERRGREVVRGPICCKNVRRRGEGPGQYNDRGGARGGCSMQRCRGALRVERWVEVRHDMDDAGFV
jgi:hypothetical protein